MSKFILKPARILLTALVTSKTSEVLELDFSELCRKLVPDLAAWEVQKLGGLTKGTFIGRVRSARTSNKLVVFRLKNADYSGNIAAVLQNDPTFATRLVEAYRVEEAVYDCVITEQEIKTPQEAA